MKFLKIATVFAVLCVFLQDPAKAQQQIELNHRTGLQSPFGLVELAHQEKFTIAITNTLPDCFDYNAEAVRATEEDPTAEGAGRSLEPETIRFSVTHDRQIGSYKISATLKDFPEGDGFKDSCTTSLSNQEWTITVTTHGWAIGFAGAYTYDELTNPAFSLRPGQQVTGEGENRTTTDGFFVERDRDAEDSFNLGAAAMIHLFHTDPNTFAIFGRRTDIHWAPLSFGLGVGDGSKVKYFVGTSLRIGDQAFLTGGLLFGPRNRLPNGLSDFTTDQNALATLPTRNDSAIFFGISYAFISTGRDVFQNAFSQATPSPSQPADGEDGNGEND